MIHTEKRAVQRYVYRIISSRI